MPSGVYVRTEKHRAAQREAWDKPGARERQSAALKEAWDKPEARERQSAVLKEAWSRPEVRERHAQKSGYHKMVSLDIVNRVIEIMSDDPVKLLGRNTLRRGCDKSQRFVRFMPMGVCTLMRAHREMLKDDPERLSTEFMQSIIRGVRQGEDYEN